MNGCDARRCTCGIEHTPDCGWYRIRTVKVDNVTITEASRYRELAETQAALLQRCERAVRDLIKDSRRISIGANTHDVYSIPKTTIPSVKALLKDLEGYKEVRGGNI